MQCRAERRRGARCRSERTALHLARSAAPAVHEGGLDAVIVLPNAAKVRAEVLELDGAKGDVLSHGEIRTAADGHAVGAIRCGAEARSAGCCAHTTEQELRVRGEAAIAVVREPGPEQIVDFMRRGARRQPSDFAATEIADYAEPVIEVHGSRARYTLAVVPRSSSAWIAANKLIVAGDLKTLTLSLGRTGHKEHEAEQNEQLTHDSLHLRFPTMGLVL